MVQVKSSIKYKNDRQIIASADLTFLKQASTKFEGIMFLWMENKTIQCFLFFLEADIQMHPYK